MNQKGFVLPLIIIVVLILLGSGIYFYQNSKSSTSLNPSNPPNSPNSPNNPNLPNPSDSIPQPSPSPTEYPVNPELEKLAKAAAIKYFEKFKTSTKDEEKILDYSIEEINQAHFKNNELRFFINHSVEIPTDLTFSNWQAGNGSGMDKDGWIKNNKGYVSAIKLNDEYQVQGIATGVGNDF